jgi:D-alanine--(R)-lactate ligase
MTKSRIAILFGGMSEEHDVSVKSAREIAAAIDTGKYEPVYVGITRAGVWKLCDRPDAGWADADGPRAVLSADRETRGLLVGEDAHVTRLRIDAVFPVLHGRGGEDGAIQGLLELSGIPYVGCDIAGSAICMDKSLAYLIASSAGIATPPHRVVPAGEAVDAESLRYPVFVKPARSGSSFGVQKVERGEHLEAALADARRYDDKVLIEEAVRGTEVGCAVLGDGPDLTVGEVDQITLSHGFFHIHQESAPESGSENAVITVPAPLPDATRERVRETAQAIYTALGLRGLARVDMFLTDDGRIVLNEVNTMPGFTSYSRYPRMMAAAGIGLTELIDRSLALAMNR